MRFDIVMPMLLVYSYLFAINVLAFFLYASDKHRACYDKRRIPEALLLGLAILGGAYGAGCGMLLFRHKTLHRSFLITIPICLVIWAAILVFLVLKYK